MDEPSIARLMLTSEQRDVDACRVLAAAPDTADVIVGFHAQQTIEKSLKAVLSHRAIEFPRTHDLAALMDLLADHGSPVPDAWSWIDELNPYAVEARYGLVHPGRLDRRRALQAERELLAWARGLVDGGPAPG